MGGTRGNTGHSESAAQKVRSSLTSTFQQTGPQYKLALCMAVDSALLWHNKAEVLQHIKDLKTTQKLCTNYRKYVR